MNKLTPDQQLHDIAIEESASQGKMLIRYEGQVVFVDGGCVGDLVDIKINTVHKNFSTAVVTKIHRASEYRVAAKCEHYSDCGGCQFQHIAYNYQLSLKRNELTQTLSKLSGCNLPEIEQVIATDQQWQSRNKLSFRFSNNCLQSNKPGGKVKGIGFHSRSNPEELVDIKRCLHMPDVASDIAIFAKETAIALALSFLNETKNQGLLRDLIVRKNRNHEYMVIIHTSYDSVEAKELANKIFDHFEAVSSLYLAVNHEKTYDMRDAKLEHIAGETHLVDHISDLQFAISPKAFYQTNAEQAEKLYQRIAVLAGINTSDTVYDLYCGTGTIGISIASKAKRVVGIELVSDAIDDAKRNAGLNEIDNIAFYTGRAETIINKQFIKNNGKPTVVIVDPPRAGLDEALCKQLCKLRPAKLVYVSCDSATQARDIQRLSKDFDVKAIDAIDMFPNSYHCETVALLEVKAKPIKTDTKRRLVY